MLRRLFVDHSIDPKTPTRSFRPRLEALEERVSPDASMFPGTTPTYGPSVPMYGTSATPSSEGSFAFNSLIAFGLPPSSYALYALGGAPVSGYVAVPYQQATAANSGGLGSASSGGLGNGVSQLERLIGSLYQMAAAQNPQQASTLVSDEFFRGLATSINHVGQSLGINGLMQDSINAYQNAINQNPLEQGEVGQLLGSLVFDLTFYLSSTGQAGGF